MDITMLNLYEGCTIRGLPIGVPFNYDFSMPGQHKSKYRDNEQAFILLPYKIFAVTRYADIVPTNVIQRELLATKGKDRRTVIVKSQEKNVESVQSNISSSQATAPNVGKNQGDKNTSIFSGKSSNESSKSECTVETAGVVKAAGINENTATSGSEDKISEIFTDHSGHQNNNNSDKGETEESIIITRADDEHSEGLEKRVVEKIVLSMPGHKNPMTSADVSRKTYTVSNVEEDTCSEDEVFAEELFMKQVSDEESDEEAILQKHTFTYSNSNYGYSDTDSDHELYPVRNESLKSVKRDGISQTELNMTKEDGKKNDQLTELDVTKKETNESTEVDILDITKGPFKQKKLTAEVNQPKKKMKRKFEVEYNPPPKKVKALNVDDENAETSNRRTSTRLKSVGFRPDYHAMEKEFNFAFDSSDSCEEYSNEDEETSSEEDPDSDYVPNEFLVNPEPVKKSQGDELNEVDSDHGSDLSEGEVDEICDDDEDKESAKKKKEALTAKQREKRQAKAAEQKSKRIKIILAEHKDKYRVDKIVSHARKDRAKAIQEVTTEVMGCAICNEYCSTSEKEMETHIEIHLNKDLCCKICTYEGRTRGELMQHKRQEHRTNLLICYICGDEFFTQKAFNKHLGEKHDDPQYACSFCAENGQISKSISTKQLRVHCLENHPGTVVQCPICRKLLSSQTAFELHEIHCNADTCTHVCDVCGRTATSEYHLARHKASVHSHTRLFKCTECSFSAFTKKRIDRHMLVHEEESQGVVYKNRHKRMKHRKAADKPVKYARNRPEDQEFLECESIQRTGTNDKRSNIYIEDESDDNDTNKYFSNSDSEYVHSDEEQITDSLESDIADSRAQFYQRGRMESRIPYDEMETDVNNSNLYVRKVQISSVSKLEKANKYTVVYNQAHACIYCKKVVTNISKHLKKHASEPEVKEVQELGKVLGYNHAHVRAKWDLLRNQGDHYHNLKVIRDGEGEFIIGRRQPGKFDVSQYGPCPNCFVWIYITALSNHQPFCPGISAQLNKEGLQVVSLYQSGKLSDVAGDAFKNEVFTIMANDEIGKVAMNDRLIIILGNMLMTKNMGNELKQMYYTSSRMRENARLLINLREGTDLREHNMINFLYSEYFDKIAVAALKTASPAFDDLDDLKAPSKAIKLRYDLKRLAWAKLGIAIKEGCMHEREITEDFMKLIDMEWTEKVTKITTSALRMRNLNKDHPLPEPEDVEKIMSAVKEEIGQITEELHTKPSQALFRRGVMLAETRLLMFNKSRAGEIEGIRVKEFKKHTSGITNLQKALSLELSGLEETLIESQEFLKTRGKFGGVPVIIPRDTVALIDLLADTSVRKVAGIENCNSYLFANNNIGVLRSNESLKLLCSEMNLQKPKQLTTRKLRQYIATISQVFDLSSKEQSWVEDNLKHFMAIHEIHYEPTSCTMERLDITKLVLLQEFNMSSKYTGRKLCDIDLKELCTDTSGNSVPSPEELEESQESAVVYDFLEESSIDLEGYIPDAENDALDKITSIESDESTDKGGKKTVESNGVKRRKKVKRVAWTKGDIEEINEIFKEYLVKNPKKKCPRRYECLNAINRSIAKGGTLWKRDWLAIKKKVNNMANKIERSSENLISELSMDASGNSVLSSNESQKQQETAVAHDANEECCADLEGYIPDAENDEPDKITSIESDENTDKGRKKTFKRTAVKIRQSKSKKDDPDKITSIESDESKRGKKTFKRTAVKIRKSKSMKVKRVSWTEDEIDEINELFREYLVKKPNKKCPRQADCLYAMNRSKAKGGTLWKRHWETLKKKVNNMTQNIQKK